MEKLVVFALALMAIAFSAGSAYKTTVVNGHGGCPWCPDCLSNYNGCIMDNPQEQLNHCKMHLTQMVGRPFQQHLEQCCSQLKQVNEQCQCDAIQQVFNEAVQPQGVAQMLRKAKQLPKDCMLEVQKCSLVSPTDV